MNRMQSLPTERQRNEPHDLPADGLVGFELFHGQEALGTIEELIVVDWELYYLVVTRHWTFGECRLVPGSVIDRGRSGPKDSQHRARGWRSSAALPISIRSGLAMPATSPRSPATTTTRAQEPRR
jgi:hypothetical protein